METWCNNNQYDVYIKNEIKALCDSKIMKLHQKFDKCAKLFQVKQTNKPVQMKAMIFSVC